MSSIKDEPTEGESPVTVPPPLPIDEPTEVKCEWSLAGVCACEDGQCEDCQASEEEDDEKENILTRTPAATWTRNSLENDETEFHPPIWEDCEEAKDTDKASDAENEDAKPVLETIDDHLGDRPIREQVNTAEIKGEIKEEILDNVEDEGNANKGAEMQVDASHIGAHMGSLSPLISSRGSTRTREASSVNVNVPTVEEVIVKSESEEEASHVTVLVASSPGALCRSIGARKGSANVQQSNIEQGGSAVIKEESPENAEKVGNANQGAEMGDENCQKAEMQVEASQMTVQVDSLSPLVLCASMRNRNGNLTAMAVDEMMAESETEANSNHQQSMEHANTAQRNQVVIANCEESDNVSIEPEPEEEAGQAEASESFLSLRRSSRVRKRAVNYALLPEAEEEMSQDDLETGTSDSDETETETELETDGYSSETEESSLNAANDSAGRHFRRSSSPCGQGKRRFASKATAPRQHQIKKPRPFVCSQPDCGCAFGSQSRLDAHTIIHTDLRPFSCGTCDATFNQKGSLVRHQSTHTDARPYVCAVCKMAFKANYALVRHTMLHSASKPFTCADCGISFTEKSTLARHHQGKAPCVSRYAPSERRPFVCTVEGCGRAYKTRKTLNAHICTHSGAKKLKCSVCERAFSRRGTLRRHNLTFH